MSLRLWNCVREKCIGSVFEEIGLGIKTEETISKKLTSHLGLLGNLRFLCLLYKHPMSSQIYQCTHCSAPLQWETQTLHLNSGPCISAPCRSSCFQFPSPVSDFFLLAPFFNRHLPRPFVLPSIPGFPTPVTYF